jgi:aspartyl-tRNA(Asn)/glutamyl-tRNA(Gln) amidotransferase subunit A
MKVNSGVVAQQHHSNYRDKRNRPNFGLGPSSSVFRAISKSSISTSSTHCDLNWQMLSRAASVPAVAVRTRRQDATPFTLCSRAFQTNNTVPSQKIIPISSNAFISHSEAKGEDVKIDTPKSSGWKKGGSRKRHYAVKDNIASLGQPTTCASKLLHGYQSPFHASVLEQAHTGYNSRIVGKTNLDEFGMGSHSINSFFGSVRNIREGIVYSAGGSSGGSAMSLLSEGEAECSFALGTDTGGSVRLPAAYTGVIGFKPSYGILSRHGVIPYANSLDTVGIMAHKVDRIAETYLSILHHDQKDPTSLPKQTRQRATPENINKYLPSKNRDELKRLREAGYWSRLRTEAVIGVPVEYNIAELDPEVRKAWQRSLELLQEEGCTIVPISLPNTKHALSSYYIIAPAEAASNLSKYDGVRYGRRAEHGDGVGDVLYSATRAGFGDEVKRRILLGSYTLSSEAIDNYFIKAQRVRRLVQRDFDRVFTKPNPLRDPEHFDLSDMDETIELEDKLGPSQVDFIICPTAPTTAPKLEDVQRQTSLDSYMNDVFTVPASLAGLPAISIPFKIPRPDCVDPPPIGIQIIGQHSDDIRVLGMAREMSQILHTLKQRLLGQPLERFVETNEPGPLVRTVGVSEREPSVRFVEVNESKPSAMFVDGKDLKTQKEVLSPREAAQDRWQRNVVTKSLLKNVGLEGPIIRKFPTYKAHGEDVGQPPLKITKYESSAPLKSTDLKRPETKENARNLLNALDVWENNNR